MFLFRLLPCNVILRTELQSCQESDKCAYRKAWLKLGSKMAAHRSACILGALLQVLDQYDDVECTLIPCVFYDAAKQGYDHKDDQDSSVNTT